MSNKEKANLYIKYISLICFMVITFFKILYKSGIVSNKTTNVFIVLMTTIVFLLVLVFILVDKKIDNKN